MAGMIGAALGAVGSIFGGVKAAKAAKKAKRAVEAQRKKNDDWFNRRYNEDATQRADTMRLLTKTEEMLRDRHKEAQGAVAMGASEESVASAKASANNAMSDMMSDIVANNEARKDSIEATYRANDDAYNNQLTQIETDKAKAIGQAVQGVTSAVGNMSLPFSVGKAGIPL